MPNIISPRAIMSGVNGKQGTLPLAAVIVPIVVVAAVSFFIVIYYIRKRIDLEAQTNAVPSPSQQQQAQGGSQPAGQAANSSTSSPVVTEGMSHGPLSSFFSSVRAFLALPMRSDVVGARGTSFYSEHDASFSVSGERGRSSRLRSFFEPPQRGTERYHTTEPRLARTQSRVSVRTVPAYKTEVGEDEMVLFKSTSNEGQIELGDLGSVPNTPHLDEMAIEVRDERGSGRQAQDWAQAEGRSGGRSRQESQTPRDITITIEDSTETPNAGQDELGQSNVSSQTSIRRSLDTRVEHSQEGRSEDPFDSTPQYESLYPPLPTSEVQNPSSARDTPGRSSSEATHAQGRRSVFRAIFQRHSSSNSASGLLNASNQSTGTASLSTRRHQRNLSAQLPTYLGDSMARGNNSSQTSLALTPSSSSSRISFMTRQRTTSGAGLGTPRGPGSAAGTPDLDSGLAPRGDIFSHSFGNGPNPRLAASALARSQYEPPRRGLTQQQLNFLSSVESLGRYGLPTPGTSSSEASFLFPIPNEESHDEEAPPAFPEESDPLSCQAVAGNADPGDLQTSPVGSSASASGASSSPLAPPSSQITSNGDLPPSMISSKRPPPTLTSVERADRIRLGQTFSPVEDTPTSAAATELQTISGGEQG
ncbi:hypothetical protein IE53DRAFT_371197 [Violaceomyces palustris]|uniref:Uncharacterized protein n=1 Tax=Violaceomyces palustris TaxID=1673888 RepID=A0ACD0NPP0_9BASI|nr:hypothetical protein IE53DRAFT_371197 [Violaceomyces palustris]